MKLTTGKSEKVLSESGGIYGMKISGQRIYYTTSADDSWKVRSVTPAGADKQNLCDGVLLQVDSTYAYCLKYLSDNRDQMFRIDLETGKKTSVKTAKAGQTLAHIGNSEVDDYYYLYDADSDKLVLYRLNTDTGKLLKVATEKRPKNSGTSSLQVADVKQLNGELYYDYGSYEGTGNFWYGVIKKLDTDGKKQTVTSQSGSDRLIAGSKELYYGDSNGDNYKYNLSTGKKSKYSLDYQKGIDYSVLGDKTYMADRSNSKKLVISRFRSGTARETLTKNFITISFKQKKNISYTVTVKQVGIYNVVCVAGTDFTDANYGWRGKLTSMNYYVTDGGGTVLGSFK
jgi:hypothetical protein